MKKKSIQICVLIIILFLSSCTNESVYYPEININSIVYLENENGIEVTYIISTEEYKLILPTYDEGDLNADSTTYELCPICHSHYVHEALRQPTPPVNIYDGNITELTHDFGNIHTVTYLQRETEWYGTIILYSDMPLTNFSFVSLDVAGHDWVDGELVIDTKEVLLAIPNLLPADVVILNVAFAHYLLPHGAIIFANEIGEQRRMFIQEDMRGGCFPLFHLGLPHEFPTY